MTKKERELQAELSLALDIAMTCKRWIAQSNAIE
jgi:hypothetical protein